jgi:hypothetical protein
MKIHVDKIQFALQIKLIVEYLPMSNKERLAPILEDEVSSLGDFV